MPLTLKYHTVFMGTGRGMETGMLVFERDEWRQIAEDLTLSPRQSDVLYLLLTGKSDKQISKEAGIALPTVRTHFGRLFQKFNVQDRSELILSVFYHYKQNGNLHKSR